jgi:hypothetical protein
VLKQTGKGLLIDLHGHGHAIQRLELGYLLSGSNLRSGNNYLNSTAAIEKSSIRYLALNNKQNIPHAALLNGQESLGGFFETERYPAVPGPADLAPRSGEDYFSGGYNTERHGSVDSGYIDAIQLECNFSGVRDNEISLRFFAEATANALLKYLKTHYFGKDGLFCPTITTATGTQQMAASWSIFPNPACHSITVDIPQPGRLSIYDLTGRILQTASFTTSGAHALSLPFKENFVFLQFIGRDGSGSSMKFLRECP